MLSFALLSWGSLAPPHHQVGERTLSARGGPRAGAETAVQLAAAIATQIPPPTGCAGSRLGTTRKPVRGPRERRPADVGRTFRAVVAETLNLLTDTAQLSAPLDVQRARCGARLAQATGGYAA